MKKTANRNGASKVRRCGSIFFGSIITSTLLLTTVHADGLFLLNESTKNRVELIDLKLETDGRCERFVEGYFYNHGTGSLLPTGSIIRVCDPKRKGLKDDFDDFLTAQSSIIAVQEAHSKLREEFTNGPSGNSEISKLDRLLGELRERRRRLWPELIPRKRNFERHLLNGDLQLPARVILDQVDELAEETKELRRRLLETSGGTISRPDPRRFAFDLGVGNRWAKLPDLEIGIQNLGINTRPLIDIERNLSGPFFRGGLSFKLKEGNKGWSGRFGAEIGQLDGTNRQTIGSFAGGQLPTYIDLTGLGGFGFNSNARVTSRSELDAFKFSAEIGRQFAVRDNVFARPYAGAFYRYSNLQSSITMDTDFGAGTFQNTLNERIKLNQLGADIGLDLTWTPTNRTSLTLGGHVGLSHTDARYKGSDCGDASIGIVGCDGGLFLNNNIKAGNSNLGVIGGIKAALGFYVFCRENSAAIVAGLIDASVEALKNSCVEVNISGELDSYPDQKISRPTAIGNPAVSLSGGRYQSRNFNITLKARF